jgi:hypothetical protein
VSNGLPELLHQLLIVVEVVQGTEMSAENLADAVEVVQIGARKVPAGVARAGLVKRSRVVLVLGVAMRTSPWRVNRWPLRALRVGSTQSNMSIPSSTAATRSSGVPTPIR